MNLGEMKTSLGDYLNDPSSTRYVEALRIRMINIAYREYQNELVQAGHEGLLVTDDLDLVADTATVALPSDFFIIQKLSRALTSKRVPLEYAKKLDAITRTTGSSSGDGYIPTYTIQGTNILLDPLPSSDDTDGLHLEYFPIITEMTTDGTSPASGFSAQFHPMIPLKAAILLKGTKEDETVTNLHNILTVMERPFRSLIQSLTKQKKRVSRFIT